MKINIDLTQLNEEEFISFLMNDVNKYILDEFIPSFKRTQDTKKWSAALDIVRANMDFYSLYSDFDLTKTPVPHYISFPYKCGI